jgi:hypothetical protein
MYWTELQAFTLEPEVPAEGIPRKVRTEGKDGRLLARDSNVAERNAAALNSFQYPSEMTPTLPSVTLMAV